jgi:hypothetical protein
MDMENKDQTEAEILRRISQSVSRISKFIDVNRNYILKRVKKFHLKTFSGHTENIGLIFETLKKYPRS